MATTIEQVAAHEAGHATVSLAIGAQLLRIAVSKGKHPESRFQSDPDFTFVTELVPGSADGLEARLTYLAGVGGMAGEIVLEGAFHSLGAEDDLAKMKDVNLTDAEIDGLTQISVSIINANQTLWREIAGGILTGIESKQKVLLDGDAFNFLFNIIGTRFTDFTELDRPLPLDN